MKRFLLALGLFLGLAAPASAACTVNTVQQVGVICDAAKNATYTASSVGLVPASSATDIFCISPSATAGLNVSIKKITISGTAGTAITTPFLVYRRVSLDTGGTPATSLALPVAVPMNGGDPASSATLTAYTANPTIVDSSPKLMDVLLPTLAVTTTANSGGATGTYGTGSVDLFEKGLDLQKNTTQQICVSLNGVSVSSGVVNITMQWQEAM